MKDEEIKNTEPISESNAMKVIRGTGQSIDAPTVPEDENSKKTGKIGNFWYHHKWHMGITVGMTAIVVVLMLQLVLHKTPDVYMMYAGPGIMIGNQYEKFEAAVTEVMHDYDGNGYKKISFTDNTYLTSEQIAARREMGLYVDESGNAAAYQRFKMEIAAGEHMFCMLDPGLYQDLAQAGAFVPLDELLDKIPAGAVDGYGVRLGDTAFYTEHPELSFIPPDTVLAVRIPGALTMKSEEEEKEYSKRHQDLFRDIVLYTPEDK